MRLILVFTQRKGPCSIPGQLVWDLWCTNWHWDRFCSPSTSVLPCRYHSTNSPRCICSNQKDKRTKPGDLQECKALLQIAKNWMQNYFHLTSMTKIRRRGSALPYPIIMWETLMLDKPKRLPVRVSANFESIFRTEQTCKWRDLC